MSGKYRPILPANNAADAASGPPAGGAGSSGDPDRPGNIYVPKPKRSPIYTACNHCRRRKIKVRKPPPSPDTSEPPTCLRRPPISKAAKCDGKTPTCTRCINKQLDCEYDVEPDVSRQVSLKRKYEVMQDEASQLKELYRYLHDRPEREGIEILRRIRTTTDPLQVLRFIKEGDLLIDGLVTDSPPDGLDPRARRLDDEAYEVSSLKVRARPWTTVAHDGIVSELISSFFAWDQPFYACYVDKDMFMADLATEDLENATWCSPLLINAICALRCMTSERARRYGLIEGVDLGNAFLSESRSLFDLEYGKATIPTVQALLLMFVLLSGQGRDRAGLMFRYIAYEMLKRMKLEKWYHKLDGQVTEASEREQTALSRMVWGVYCFENVASFVYLKPSLMPRPKNMPKHFPRQESSRSSIVDIHGAPFAEGSYQPPLVVGMLAPTCSLSEIVNDVMLLYDNGHDGVGSQADLSKRWALYERLSAWERDLPDRFRSDKNFNPQTYYLSMVFVNIYSAHKTQAILGIFRPLDHGQKLPGGGNTAGKICVEACIHDVEGLEELERLFGFDDYSPLALTPMYNASMTLVSRLYDPATHSPFTNVCRIMLGCVSDFPFIFFLFKALWALAKQLKQTLPPDSVQYFKATKLVDFQTNEDIPISFVLPQYEDFAEVLSHESRSDQEETRTHLGSLIARWNSMSLS